MVIVKIQYLPINMFVCKLMAWVIAKIQTLFAHVICIFIVNKLLLLLSLICVNKQYFKKDLQKVVKRPLVKGIIKLLWNLSQLV